MNDPIVDEVRRFRMEHTRKFGGNLNLICEDLRRLQQASDCKVVRRPPRLLAPSGRVKGHTPAEGGPES